MALKHISLLCALPLLALGAKKRSTSDTFGLYGYGEGYGGFSLFYADGYAYLGDPSQSNNTDAAIVEFSLGSDDTWIGSPNATLSIFSKSTKPSWSNVTLYVPASMTTDSRVGFLSSNETSDSNMITSGFTFYGSTASLIGADGQLETLWSALRINDNLHALYWNDTSLGQSSIILRNIAPSNPSD